MLVRIAAIKKSTKNKCWQGCGKKGALLNCWWDCKLVQPLWTTVCRFLKKLEIELSYNPTTPFLGIHTDETRIGRDTCTPMFTEALFTVSRTWKQPWCPSADEWMGHIYNGTLLSYKKGHIWVSFNEVDETVAYYIEWCKLGRETPNQYINTYMWNLERW